MSIWLHAVELHGEDGKIATPKCSLNVCTVHRFKLDDMLPTQTKWK